MSKEDFENGLKVRREVMGEDFVNQRMGNTTAYMEPVQEWINENAWGSVWQRGGIDRKTRSLVTIGMLAALKASTEIRGHIQGALNNGATAEEIREVLLHSAVYCGAPAAQDALRAGQDLLEDAFEK